MADPANECFALRREDGSLTGEIKPRALVHRDGDLHGASHVFLARLRGERVELLLQKRSAQKDSFPGLYDISAAGHLDPGEDFAAAARGIWRITRCAAASSPWSSSPATR